VHTGETGDQERVVVVVWRILVRRWRWRQSEEGW